MSSLAPIVEVARASTRKAGDQSFTFTFLATPARIAALERANDERVLNVQVDGSRIREFSRIANGSAVEVTGDLGGNENHLARSFASLLSYQSGRFQGEFPAQFYLLEEDVASFDTTVNQKEVRGYFNLPKFLEFLKQVSDLDSRVSTTRMFSFLGHKRLHLEVRYDVESAARIPSLSVVDEIQDALFCEPNREQKLQLFKNVLSKALEGVPPSDRFVRLLVRFEAVVEAFRNDYQAFLTEFSHDRRREEFERLRVAHLQKITSAVTDVWGKLLAIPVGQALLVTQFKPDVASALSNVALMAGSTVFLILGLLLFYAHGHVLGDLREEINEEIAHLEGRFDKGEVEKRFRSVRRRLRVVRWLPIVLAVFLSIGPSSKQLR